MNFQFDASLNCALDMSGSAKKEARRKSSRKDDERTLQSLKQELKPRKRKVGSFLHECNGNTNLKRKIVKKAIVCQTKTSKKQPSLTSLKEKLTTISKKKKKIEKKDDRDENLPNSKRRRSRKKRKNNVELDEASKLQRRTRYLLIRMKLEQNLLDAYSAEGWKGQSREKIRPEKELQRAKMQILKYKLGIREAIHQLDLLSSEGQISNSAVAPDGSVHHEHIICAKCKLREALPDNDIILCDGTCNCAFHQKCIDPPLSTENIPPGDQGWFCKFCKKKMEILEATNAHLGTHFPVDSSWEDVFKEEAALPDGGNYMSCQGEEWPSDDSEDDDYDPDRKEYSCSESASKSECDASDCSSSFIVEERCGKSVDNSLELIGEDSDDINNAEVVSHPRQRASVDYIKLYNEMFGKNATESEQISDDEEWGPTKRKRKVKESDAASTLMTLGETGEKNSEEIASELDENRLIKKMRRPIFRLPHNAVEKLRLVFAENELPARTLRVSLSEQLGLEFEKVNKWFKNARYLALRARKQAERAEVSENVSPVLEKESLSETSKGVHFYRTESSENTTSPNPKSSHKFVKRRNSHLPTNSFEIKQCNKRLLQTAANSNQMSVDVGEDVSLKQLREKAKKANKKKKSELHEKRDGFEREMERLCEMKSRVENLQQSLLQLPIRKFGNKTNSTHLSVILVPIAQLKEKT
ncbi:hypothetical protein ACP275_10G073400 [Erythranthe tilingii]